MTTTQTRRPRRELTPVDITARFPSFNGRRLETWSAASRDGIWKYERIEDTGTPWAVIHVPTNTEGDWYGSLPKARAATASGEALAYVERVQAHERGEHEAEREPRCSRC
jgi:hypothetical protein